MYVQHTRIILPMRHARMDAALCTEILGKYFAEVLGVRSARKSVFPSAGMYTHTHMRRARIRKRFPNFLAYAVKLFFKGFCKMLEHSICVSYADLSQNCVCSIICLNWTCLHNLGKEEKWECRAGHDRRSNRSRISVNKMRKPKCEKTCTKNIYW